MNRWTYPVLLFVASVAGLGLGATLPLVALRMLQAGASALDIGIVSALPAVGMVLAALLCSRLCRRLSRGQLYAWSLALCALSIGLLEGPSLSLYAMGLLRLLMGLGLGLIVILSESWVNELCDDANRGKSVALYTTAFTGCQLLGPSLIALLGAQGPWVVVVVGGAFVLAWVGALCSLADNTLHPHEPGAARLSLWGFVRLAPTLCLGVLFFSFFDSVILAMFPVYGAAMGYTATLAALMVTVILLGDMAFQLPLGWLADRLNRKRLHLLCGALVLTLGLALPWLMGSGPLLWPALVLLGATAGAIYTLSIIQIGQRFRGQALVTANAGAGLLWGVGSVLGPLLSGALMQVSSSGLPMALALMAGLFVCAAWVEARRTTQRYAQSPTTE